MDLQEVLKLLALMESHGLDEIEVEQGGVRIRLKKQSLAQAVPMMAAPVVHAASHPSAPAGAPAVAAPAEEKDLVKITSPMVGTFYRAASPESEPFVGDGDHVGIESVVCIIEAMKVMNEIKAEVDGDIVAIHVENGESVEFGQPLFTVRRNPQAK